MDAELSDVQPQPTGPRGRGDQARQGSVGTCSGWIDVGSSAVRLRGSRRSGELPPLSDRVAIEPARLVGEGQRVLSQTPAGTTPMSPHATSTRCGRRRCGGETRRLSGSWTCCFRWTFATPVPRCSPTSCCPRRRGTRSTTCRVRTCIRLCTHSRRQFHRPGKPRPISRRFIGLRAVSRGLPRSTSVSARTSWPYRYSTTVLTPPLSPVGACLIGKPGSVNPFRVRRCRGWLWWSATTRRLPRR